MDDINKKVTDDKNNEEFYEQPHESDSTVSVTSLDESKIKDNRIIEWAKENKPMAILASVVAVSSLTLGGLGISQLVGNDQVTTDVVPARSGIQGSQNILGNAKMVDSYGKGTIATVDHDQGGKEVSAKIVAIDATGSNNAATLVPPENIGTVGWYFRSASPGSTKGDGTTVMTSHVNYDGITGYGSVFITLKKGDPITVTDKDGKVVHYTVSQDPYRIDKRDENYVKKTMNTINRSKGRNSLILITCGGNYVGGALGYEENYIVEAHLTDL